MNLANTSVAVIGGAGLIGSHTVDLLTKENVREIVVYDNLTSGKIEFLKKAFSDQRVKFVNGDVGRQDQLDAIIRGADAVVHLAASLLLKCRAEPIAGFDLNVKGTLNVMQSCVDHKVGRLVYASSTSVYGDAIEEPMTEEHPFNNMNMYGATKIASEALLHAYHHEYGLQYVAMRYTNVYGPRQGYAGVYMGVVTRMFDSAERGESPVIFGDGNEAYDLILVDDAARANICALNAESTDRGYNIGTGVKTSLSEVAEMIRELTGCKAPVVYKPRQHSATLVRNRVASTNRASDELGFRSTVALRDGLERLRQWRAANPWAIGLTVTPA
ncbi:SDR family NAD(P)-dependent oxidoreductase [Mesorhizobium sp. M0809]|uniref:SDR family NAD(P)-dependent oxidoreductase n=1 Tax=Mesorhizobium sp. M0809 TaxID=2957003 RepID=UPI00333D230B